MKRTLVAALTATALVMPVALPLPLMAETGPTVKSIDVTVDIGAVQNPAAAAYWGTLETDLESAILSHLTDRIAEDGAKIAVDIDEVSLASGFAEAMGLGDSMLKGTVNESHDTDNSRFDSYELTVDMNATLPLLGEGFDITAANVDTAQVYRAMVDTFARHVAENVK